MKIKEFNNLNLIAGQKVKVSFIDCSNCLYCDKCPDACKVIKCDWDLDCEDDRLDGEIDRVVLSVYDY